MRPSTRLVVLGNKKYFLDLIFFIAAAAYGLRRLYASWTGAAIRVRRSSDDAEADIGFTANGDLDTVALLAFVGNGSGFVTTWYDQSGNGRHATQTTAANQPQIVSNGVLHTLGVRPTIFFTPNQYLNYSTISGQLDICLIAKHRTGRQDYTPILGHSTLFNFHGGVGTFLFDTSHSVIKDNAGSLIINGGGSLPSTAIKPTNLSSIAIKVASATVNNLSVDRVVTGRYWDGNYSEAIFFENQNIDLSSIYLDQMSYFSITQAAG